MSSIVRIQEFLTALDSIKFNDIESYRQAVNRLCKRELDYLRSNVELTTLRRYRSDYRNAIRQFYENKELHTTYLDKKNKGKPTHIAVKYFTLKKSEVKEYASHEDDRKKAFLTPFNDVENNQLIPCVNNKPTIVNWHEMVKTAVSLLNNDSAYDIALGLLLLTGRRSVEIWKTGSFKLIPNSREQLIFSGQAKTKGSANAKDNYPIFVLCNSDLIVAALARLRSIKDFTNHTEREVNSNTAPRMSKLVKRHFNCFVLNYGIIECKDLRSIYVHIAHFLYEPHYNIRDFACLVLGHATKNTAENYDLFTLGNKD